MKYSKYIILNIFLIIFLLLSVLSYLFKAKPLIVISDSMSPVIKKGDLVVIVKSDQYKIDDIISFENEGHIATHRVVDIENNNSNKITKLRTKGDANKSSDFSSVEIDNVIGKVNIIIPYLGYLFLFFQSKYLIYVLFIIILFLLIEKIRNDKK